MSFSDMLTECKFDSQTFSALSTSVGYGFFPHLQLLSLQNCSLSSADVVTLFQNACGSSILRIIYMFGNSESISFPFHEETREERSPFEDFVVVIGIIA